MLELSDYVFYLFGTVLVLFSLMVVTSSNPIFSALYLAVTMIGLSGMFFGLDAYFVAGVQLIVYAGAVMVLFVIVLMLFDLRKEVKAFSKGKFSGFLKLFSSFALLGLIAGAVYTSSELLTTQGAVSAAPQMSDTRALAKMLFTDYLFAFEVLGVLLLLIAVGVVSLSRIKGGTHARG